MSLSPMAPVAPAADCRAITRLTRCALALAAVSAPHAHAPTQLREDAELRARIEAWTAQAAAAGIAQPEPGKPAMAGVGSGGGSGSGGGAGGRGIGASRPPGTVGGAVLVQGNRQGGDGGATALMSPIARKAAVDDDEALYDF
jgi:hypothetical protein